MLASQIDDASAIDGAAMTDIERLILENQKCILHGLRILIVQALAPMHQFETLSDQMAVTHDAFNEDNESRRRHRKAK